MFDTVLLSYIFCLLNLKKKKKPPVFSYWQHWKSRALSCRLHPSLRTAFLVSALQNTGRATHSGRCLLHRSAGLAISHSQGIQGRLFLRYFWFSVFLESLQVLFLSWIIFFPSFVLFSVQHCCYFTWLAVDNFSLWKSLSFKFSFLIVSWERNTVSGLCFIIYILGGEKQRHGNSKDSFRDQLQANTW